MTLPWVDYKPGAGIWDDLYGYNHGILTTITWDISITPISMAIYHHLSSLELHPEVGFQAQARRKTPIGTWECVPVMCCNGHMYAYTYKQYMYIYICNYMHTIKYACCMYVCLSVSQSVSQSVCLPGCRSVCLYVCLSVCMSVCLSVCVCVSVCLCVCTLRTYVRTYVCVSFSICIF